jgi:Ca2+-binding RTX toxin-like protein
MKQNEAEGIQYREEVMGESDGMYHAFFQDYWYQPGIAGATGKVIKGDINHNRITGTRGDDTISGLEGDDTIDGSDGDDKIYGGDQDDLLYGGTGEDTLYGEYDDDYLCGGSGDDMLYGGANNDKIDGGRGEDRLYGGTGMDTLYGGMEEDWLDGGSDNDILYGYTPCLVTGAGDEQLPGSDGLFLRACDTIFGGSGHDKIYGYYDDDYLDGGTGNDTIYGDNGDDYLDGGTGKDKLYGGAGNDIYFVDNSGDVVREEADEGIDSVQSSITYTLGANLEDLALTGTDAINGKGNALDNFLYGNSADNTLTGCAGNDTLYGNEGNDTLNGGTGNDYFSGGTGNDILFGDDGNDTLDGKSSADRMYGGSGSDVYYVDDAGDAVVEYPPLLFEEPGIDTVISSIDYTLPDGVENLTLLELDPFFGPHNISYDFNGTGNETGNIITGNHGNNSLWGLGGNDTLDGGNGNDWLHGGRGNDHLDGGAGGDAYLFNLGDGLDTIADRGNDASTDYISFGDTIAKDTIAFFQEGGDLHIAYGGTDYITVLNQDTEGMEKVQATNGWYLTDAEINAVIQQITAYSADHGLSLTSVDDVKNNQDLMGIIVNAWHQ